MEKNTRSSLGQHFEKHGVVHLIWLIVLLVLTIVILSSLKLGTDQSVKDILNFAVALSSMLLALVAIVQAIVSSGNMAETISAIHRAVASMAGPADDITRAAHALTEHTKSVDSNSKKISDTLAQLQGSGFEQLRSSTPAKKETFTSDMLADTSTFGMGVLYIVLLSFETQRPFYACIPPAGHDLPTDFADFVGGYINALMDGYVVGTKIKDGMSVISDLGELRWLPDCRNELLVLKTEYGTQQGLTNLIAAIDSHVANLKGPA